MYNLYYKWGGSGCLRTDPGYLYEMDFQEFVAYITGLSGSFWRRILFHNDPDFLPPKILKYPEIKPLSASGSL